MLNQDEYDKIRNIIYENTGMALKETKIDFLSRRVETRMRELDLERARDYCRFLQLDSTQREIEELVNLVVVSETYFFRDYKQLKVLAESIIPLVAEEKKKLGRHGISVLSAGCSTGEEPYTLAIIFREMLEDDHVRRLRIDGLDINRKSLEKAREGVYTDHALRETPYLYRDKYFARQGDLHRLDESVKSMVGFSRANLFDQRQVGRLGLYDIVFCRNVLIYFDRRSAGMVMGSLHEHMNRNGYIFLGSAESVGRLTDLFTMERIDGAFVYRK